MDQAQRQQGGARRGGSLSPVLASHVSNFSPSVSNVFGNGAVSRRVSLRLARNGEFAILGWVKHTDSNILMRRYHAWE